MLCGCGLSAGACRLLGGKGLGGGPDETEKLSFYLDVENSAKNPAKKKKIKPCGMSNRERRQQIVDRESTDVRELVLGGRLCGTGPMLCKTVVSEQT